MTGRTTIFPLFIFLLITWGCTTPSSQIINKQALSSVELEKVKAVKWFRDDKDFNERSYKVIQKVQGHSCGKRPVFSLTGYLREPQKSEAVDQLKIYAVRAGGNAIANIGCIVEIDNVGLCGKYMECSADAILMD